tara:strand:+ start:104 stop:529 length:426 start_codon:yes stop_codon:yes gene_type:complete
MKIKILILALLFLLTYRNSHAGKIKIMVTNIKEVKGTIHYGIYNSAENFPEEKGKIQGGYINVTEVIKNGLIISNLDEAYYAVALYHDKNSNNKFDSFFSIPTESYGFSKNAAVFLGPPKFEDASFFVGKSEEVELKIELR